MQLKRILAIFLAAALILSAFTVSVGAESLNVFEVGVAAETTTPVSSSPVIYNAGEDVKVTISAVQNTGIDYLVLKVSYEPEALEYVGYTTNGLFGVNNLETIQSKNGYLLFTAVLNEVSSAVGDMFTINFKTKDSFCGETEVVAQLSGDDEYNCMITDPDYVAVVPFVGDSTSFEIHKIDTANGVVTEPTCTEQGYTTYDCANCDVEVRGNYVAANGHTEADAVEENRVEATCTNNGSYDMVVYCSVCNAELSRDKIIVDALGHDTIPHDSKAPTCTEIGWEAYVTCSRCDYTTYVEKAALGHDLTQHEAKAPTCTEIGWNAYEDCSRCDYTTYKEIEANGHIYGESTVVEPEYKVEGYTTHTCKVCNEVVDSEDAINLLYYTLLPESISINQKCDFDGDGDVDSDDAIYLLYYTLLPEQYPLHK